MNYTMHIQYNIMHLMQQEHAQIRTAGLLQLQQGFDGGCGRLRLSRHVLVNDGGTRFHGHLLLNPLLPLEVMRCTTGRASEYRETAFFHT